jgi:hypothetical protein
MGGKMKIVISQCYGGFSLSKEAQEMYLDSKCMERGELDSLYLYGGMPYNVARDDADLVRIVETLGPEAASGRNAQLKIVEVPDEVDWYIEEYNGQEWVAEVHRTWS